MFSRAISILRAVPVLALFQLTACSSVNSFGNSILSSLGFTPKQTSYDGQTAVHDATEKLTKEQEYFLGRAVAARILALYPRVSDPELTVYVNRVGQAVTWGSDNPGTFRGFHFLVLDTKEINAISAPGGFIFLTRGLLEKLPNEDALAAVLAHEVAHVVYRHGVRSLETDSENSSFKTAMQVAGSLNCNELLGQVAVVLGAAVDDLVDRLITSGYSKEFEYEADRGAALILTRLGYDQKALTEVLVILESIEENQDEGWFSTHPRPAERVEALARSDIGGNQEGVVLAGKTIRTTRFSEILQ